MLLHVFSFYGASKKTDNLKFDIPRQPNAISMGQRVDSGGRRFSTDQNRTVGEVVHTCCCMTQPS